MYTDVTGVVVKQSGLEEEHELFQWGRRHYSWQESVQGSQTSERRS